jgi:hypothetical protein
LVAVDDGGSRGARFGCNDSLVKAHPAAGGGASAVSGGTPVPSDAPSGSPAQEPLAAAMALLLGHDGVPSGSGLYNALSSSSLSYVSGSLDGSTVTVTLAGELRQGGVCDGPRIEAQLAQTAIAATGASLAEITINGTPLPDLLSQR